MKRRRFTLLASATAGSLLARGNNLEGGERFFTLRREIDGHYWFHSPDGGPFFVLGSPGEAVDREAREGEVRAWRRHYGRDADVWIPKRRETGSEGGGFNTNCGQPSRTGGPYVHLVPFSGAKEWRERARQCDYLHRDWDEWCDHAARLHCLPRAQDRDLVGYFFTAGSSWLHDRPDAEWRGPLYDREMLRSQSGRDHLRLLARRYYEVIHKSIRRYDPNHLLLGDRFDASVSVPREIWEEAFSRVDVFSVQDFRDPARTLAGWHRTTRKPVLLVDAASPSRDAARELRWYEGLVGELLANPGCVGCHLAQMPSGTTQRHHSPSAGAALGDWQLVNRRVERRVRRLA